MKILNPNNLPLIDYRILKPLQGDLKDLNEKNYNKLKGVLNKRGFTTPLFLWHKIDLIEGAPDYPEAFYLMDGHQRQRVMTKEDMNDEGNYQVPYILIEASSEQEAKAQLLEISSQYGTITQEGFDEFIVDLPEEEVYEAINFDALPLLGKPTKGDPETEEDVAPAAGQTAISTVGSIYKLGQHRLMCGDSTDFGEVSDLLDGAADLMLFTDPPYNVGYAYNSYDDNKTPEEYKSMCAMWFSVAEEISDYQVITPGTVNLAMWATIKPWYSVAPWVKRNAMNNGEISHLRLWEPIIFYGKPKARRGTDLFEFNISGEEVDHTCPKPIALVAAIIDNSGFNNVLDLFGGSGSTLIACEQLNKKCYMMELDPLYCDVIRKRYQKFVTGGVDGWEDTTPAINHADLPLEEQAA